MPWDTQKVAQDTEGRYTGPRQPSWSQILPLVFLGRPTANHEEFAASIAGLVHWENLRLLSDPVLDIRPGLNATARAQVRIELTTTSKNQTGTTNY